MSDEASVVNLPYGVALSGAMAIGAISDTGYVVSGLSVGASMPVGYIQDISAIINGVSLSGGLCMTQEELGDGLVLYYAYVQGFSMSGVAPIGEANQFYAPSFFATYYQPAGESVSFGSVMGQSVSFGSVAGQSVSFPSEQA